jgi:hypothetical protein
MTSRTRRLRAPLAVGAATLLASVYVGLVDPSSPGHYPLCPTKAFTGLDCPGCGGLRSVHSLLHGDLTGALDHNAFVVLVVLPVALVLWARWLWHAWKGPDAAVGSGTDGPVDVPMPSPTLLWALVVLAVAFTVVRNVGGVPAFAWLASTTS